MTSSLGPVINKLAITIAIVPYARRTRKLSFSLWSTKYNNNCIYVCIAAKYILIFYFKVQGVLSVCGIRVHWLRGRRTSPSTYLQALAHTDWAAANKSTQFHLNARMLSDGRERNIKIKGMHTANFCKLMQTSFFTSSSVFAVTPWPRIRRGVRVLTRAIFVSIFLAFLVGERKMAGPLIEFIDSIYLWYCIRNLVNGFDHRQQFIATVLSATADLCLPSIRHRRLDSVRIHRDRNRNFSRRLKYDMSKSVHGAHVRWTLYRTHSIHSFSYLQFISEHTYSRMPVSHCSRTHVSIYFHTIFMIRTYFYCFQWHVCRCECTQFSIAIINSSTNWAPAGSWSALHKWCTIYIRVETGRHTRAAHTAHTNKNHHYRVLSSSCSFGSATQPRARTHTHRSSNVCPYAVNWYKLRY